MRNPILILQASLLVGSAASFSARAGEARLPYVVPNKAPLPPIRAGHAVVCSSSSLHVRGGYYSHRLHASADGVGSEKTKLAASFQAVERFVEKNFFLVGMFVAVGLARAFPALGKTGGVLRPELFIGKYGVALIFLLSGLSLELSQLTKAFSNVKLNTMIQLCIFAAWPFLVGIPLTKALGNVLPQVFPPALLDGLLITTCLPTTVNMNVSSTKLQVSLLQL